MIKRFIFTTFCFAFIANLFADTQTNEKFFYDNESEASYWRMYSLTLPDNLTSEVRSKILPKVYGLMAVNPSTLGDSSEFSDMMPMPSSMIPKYRTLYHDNFDEMGMDNWYDISKTKVVTNTPELLVIEAANQFYGGGCHGGYSQGFLNWNPSENRMITLDDYVKTPAARTNLKNLLYSKAKAELRSDMQTTKSEFKITDNFRVDSKGLTFVYEEYEIGPYSAGTPTFFIPFSSLNSTRSASATSSKKSATRKSTGRKHR